ncbi:hypothetical protein BpHYR1_017135 [Brachionus plicatilis]|uniref:Uncharacterized protein n=1 Tax=Brachionus plicatilis TaxID=10195 RepID=A0A3M7S503_BRAPC|nr:hypothetical protein BpHYR1_017135 [Brachionus plicatilis]
MSAKSKKGATRNFDQFRSFLGSSEKIIFITNSYLLFKKKRAKNFIREFIFNFEPFDFYIRTSSLSASVLAFNEELMRYCSLRRKSFSLSLFWSALRNSCLDLAST